jgi:hypothetical protein
MDLLRASAKLGQVVEEHHQQFDAVIFEGEQAVVWVERERDAKLFERRQVKIGLEQDGRLLFPPLPNSGLQSSSWSEPPTESKSSKERGKSIGLSL